MTLLVEVLVGCFAIVAIPTLLCLWMVGGFDKDRG